MTGTGVTPFRVDVPQEDVDDLAERLRRTRWPVLTDVAVYWFTRTGPSSAQLYWERAHAPTPGWSRHVPTGVAVLPHDLFRPPRAAVERVVDLVSWTECERGGHSAAMEVPTC